MKVLRLAPLFMLLVCGQAAAQQRPYRAEVFGGAGAARVGSDEGSLGSGACVAGGFGFRFARKASVEVDLQWARHERNIAGGPLQGTATGVFGDVVYHFSTGRTQIFAMGSVGVLTSSTTHSFPSEGTVIEFSSDDSNFAFGGGAGVNVLLTPHLSLRPQFRLVLSEATGVMGLAAVTVSLGYRWLERGARQAPGHGTFIASATP